MQISVSHDDCERKWLLSCFFSNIITINCVICMKCFSVDFLKFLQTLFLILHSDGERYVAVNHSDNGIVALMIRTLAYEVPREL